MTHVSSANDSAHWFAFWTRARAEARVEHRLKQKEIQAFAALARIERKWSDRTKRIRTPLFPGYVFARIDEADMVSVLGVLGVAGVVRMDGKPASIPEDEMTAVIQLTLGVDQIGTLPEAVDPLSPGKPVQVVDGPFKGLLGVILEGNQDSARVMVKIPAIRQARAIQLPRGSVASIVAPPNVGTAQRSSPNPRCRR